MNTLVKVARLYYIEDLSQQEIANRLNLARIKVHRLLAKAKKENIVEIKIVDPEENFSKLEIELEKAFGIRECAVVPYTEDFEEVFQAIGESLSSILERDMKKDSYLGIGWGTTLRGAAENIKMNPVEGLKVIPLVGGSGITAERIHSNSIASVAAAKIGGESYILNCPAIVKNPETKQVFIGEQNVQDLLHLYPKIDNAIVSIGFLGKEMTVRHLNLLTDDDISELTSLGITGDINANSIDIDGNWVANPLSKRFINAELDVLQQIKNVIAIAFGEIKHKAIFSALNSGVINTLITDNLTAQTVLEMKLDSSSEKDLSEK